MEEAAMKQKPSVILIGGSAGSLQSLFRIMPLLPATFSIPMILVVHRVAGGDSMLEDLLNAKSNMHAKEVEEKESVAPGNFYICPPDYHVLIETDRTFSLDVSEKVHYSRPSIDVTFCSAADSYGSEILAILLSGANSDGGEGIRYIKEKGGYTIIQNPQDAPVPYMPEHAIRLSTPDHIFTCLEIGKFLAQLVEE